MKSDRIHDIQPVWLRRLLLICIFAPFSYVMFMGLLIIIAIVFICHQLHWITRWWWHDYVVNVWNGTDKPDKYQPFDL